MKKILAIFLVQLMLISNMGITLSTHFCGGEPVKSALSLGRAELGCGMSVDKMDCENNAPENNAPENGIDQKTCCTNSYVQIEVESVDSPQVSTPLVDVQLLAAYILVNYQNYTSVSSDIDEYLNYSPPIIERDIVVLVQSFLI